MSATRKRQHCGWCRPCAIVTSMVLAAILIACGGDGPRPQTSAKKEGVGPPVAGNGSSTGSPESNPKFEVSVEDVGGRVCHVIFAGKLPSPATVDKIVRESLEKAVQKDPSKDILTATSLGDEDLDNNQYSGELVYKAAEKKILTFDEYHGVKTSTSSTPSYFVQIKEDHTYASITPARNWLILTIVFPKTPSREIAYDAILTEIQKVTNRGLDVDAYVSIGDNNVKTSWNQLRDNDGAYVFAEYKSATKKVTRKGELLKKL
jgi:hypothetical protein